MSDAPRVPNPADRTQVNTPATQVRRPAAPQSAQPRQQAASPYDGARPYGSLHKATVHPTATPARANRTPTPRADNAGVLRRSNRPAKGSAGGYGSAPTNYASATPPAAPSPRVPYERDVAYEARRPAPPAQLPEIPRRKLRFMRWFRTLPILAMLLCAVVSLGIRVAPDALLRGALYPVHNDTVIETAAATYGVDPYLVCAVIKCESNWSPDASSHVGAQGLMQLMPQTAQEVADLGLVDEGTYDPENLTDAATNIEYGTAYLAYLQRNTSSVDEVVAAYNAGIGNVENWKDKGGEFTSAIEYAETSAYLIRVKDALAQYQRLYPEGITR